MKSVFPADYIYCLVILFALIVVDRAVYILNSNVLKVVYHFCTLFGFLAYLMVRFWSEEMRLSARADLKQTGLEVFLLLKSFSFFFGVPQFLHVLLLSIFLVPPRFMVRGVIPDVPVFLVPSRTGSIGDVLQFLNHVQGVVQPNVQCPCRCEMIGCRQCCQHRDTGRCCGRGGHAIETSTHRSRNQQADIRTSLPK